ncbi:MAG: HXXEE domain-containing protein [Deltaproteobacteria bacterium]|nr:HXXEE domain-containing protein [Deltaproteobacteria bacterium]
MCTFLESFTLAELGWLWIAIYVLHYAEEGPLLVEWFAKHFPIRNFHYTQEKLNLENMLLFAISIAIVITANAYPENWVFQALLLGAPVGFLCNTWFHAAATLKSGVYSPGVVTACLLNPPAFLVTAAKAYQSRVLNWPVVFVAVISGLLMLPLVVSISHKIVLRKSQGPTWLAAFPVRAKSR